MARWITVANTEELAPGDRIVVEVDDYYIAIFNVDGSYYAVEDVCTHDDGPVAEGELDGFEIECPRHGARFDLRTGEALTLPAVMPIKRFDVRVDGGEVQILLDE